MVETVNRKLKVYVAGPMSGYPELNYPAFAAAAETLRARGFDVVSPAELNPITESYHNAMRKDICALIECDHIYMLQGWHASKGATLERHIASVMGIEEIQL